MADKRERTETATAKHKKEMREKGMVARSPELGGWASLLGVTMLLPWLGGLAVSRIGSFLNDVMAAMAHPSTSTAITIVGSGLATAVIASLPIVLVATAIAVAVATAQVGLHVTPKALRWKFSRVSPKTGVQRIASVRGLWSLGKTSLKVAMLALVSYVILNRLIHGLLGGATLPLQTTLDVTQSSITGMLRSIGLLALIVAGVDYGFQRRSHRQDVRMTKQEVKDERRDSDGNPEVRRAQRNRARRLTRMQVMAAVARSDVVVTNPTHFAVAVAYDRERDHAPRVVAKGADHLAKAIREHAQRCGVVLVENPPLARTLHSACEVDDPVPPALYTAVARLLAFVYSLTPSARAYGNVYRMSGDPLDTSTLVVDGT